MAYRLVGRWVGWMSDEGGKSTRLGRKYQLLEFDAFRRLRLAELSVRLI